MSDCRSANCSGGGLESTAAWRHRHQPGSSRRKWLYWTGQAGNFIGTWNAVPFVVVFIGVGVLVRRSRSQACRSFLREALFAFAIATVLHPVGNGLKLLVQSPRPAVSQQIRVDQHLTSYGFPSGHVYGDMVFLGVLAIYAPAWLPQGLVRPVRVVLLVVIFLGGPARIYVGEHWPSDVLGGYLWGISALGLAVFGAKRVSSSGGFALSRRT